MCMTDHKHYLNGFLWIAHTAHREQLIFVWIVYCSHFSMQYYVLSFLSKYEWSLCEYHSFLSICFDPKKKCTTFFFSFHTFICENTYHYSLMAAAFPLAAFSGAGTWCKCFLNRRLSLLQCFLNCRLSLFSMQRTFECDPVTLKNVITQNILRVPDQNGVSLLYIMLEIHHSGREPSISEKNTSSGQN